VDGPNVVPLTYVVDFEAPEVDGISAPSPLVQASGGSIEFTVTFSEDVVGFDSVDSYDLDLSGSATGTKSAPVGSGAGPYTVTITDVDGDGTIGITIPAGSVQDLATIPNADPASSAAQAVIDSTVPTGTAS